MRRLVGVFMAMACLMVVATPVAAAEHEVVRDSVFLEFFYFDPTGGNSYVMVTGPNLDDGFCTEENSVPRDRASRQQADSSWTSRIQAADVRVWLYDASGYADGFAFLDAACGAVVGGGSAPVPAAEGSGWMHATWANQPQLLPGELEFPTPPGTRIRNAVGADLMTTDGTALHALGTASYTINEDGSLNLRSATLEVTTP